MEVQDGFIVGIFNYCDRWCERCAFTPRCRLFADGAEHHARADPTFKAIVDAPPHPSDVWEPPAWLVELIAETNKAVEQSLKDGSITTDRLNGELPEPHRTVSKRAREYSFRVWDRWRAVDEASSLHDEPREVITWFATLISAKTYRALTGLAEFDGDREFPPDHEGSAKVALIGIERSMQAWQDLIAVNAIAGDEARPYLEDLVWLRGHLDQLIPRARAFVRPGFDEPDEVKRLEATDYA